MCEGSGVGVVHALHGIGFVYRGETRGGGVRGWSAHACDNCLTFGGTRGADER